MAGSYKCDHPKYLIDVHRFCFVLFSIFRHETIQTVHLSNPYPEEVSTQVRCVRYILRSIFPGRDVFYVNLMF